MTFSITAYLPLVLAAIVGLFVLHQVTRPLESTKKLAGSFKKKKKRKSTKGPADHANLAVDDDAVPWSSQDVNIANGRRAMQEMALHNTTCDEGIFEEDDDLESMNAAMKFALFQMFKDKSFPLHEKGFEGEEEESGRNVALDGNCNINEEESKVYLDFLQKYLSANDQQHSSFSPSGGHAHRTATSGKGKKSMKAKSTNTKKRVHSSKDEDEEEVSEWSDISE